MIELPHGSTKFRSISVKPYFIDKQEPLSDNPAPAQVSLAEASSAKIAPVETSQKEPPLADISPIEQAVKSPLATLASLALIKHGRGQSRKYSKQTNIIASSDICFLIDESDMFINNADALLAQYTAFRQKEIARLLEKRVFKVVTSADIPSNIRIFNFRFVDKINMQALKRFTRKVG